MHDSPPTPGPPGPSTRTAAPVPDSRASAVDSTLDGATGAADATGDADGTDAPAASSLRAEAFVIGDPGTEGPRTPPHDALE